MQEIEILRQSLRRALHGDAWHGPSLGELLAGVDAGAAAARPVAGGHSIHEIVLHTAFWLDQVARRIAGTAAGRVGEEEDWVSPAAGAGAAAWEAARAALWAAEEALDRALADLPAGRLGEPVTGSRHDVRTSARGAVEHALYHAGQVALLKRAQGLPVRAE
jgi:uncharacterized damage-inducible protein DinB